MTGVPLNSMWSEEDGCCTQFLSCTGCHKSQSHRVIGALIVCVDKPAPGLQTGQVCGVCQNDPCTRK